MGFDFRGAHYGVDVPMLVTTADIEYKITASIRKLREMPARGIEIGEFRLMKNNESAPQPIVKYSTYILGHNRLVIHNTYAVSVCHIVRT